MNKNRFRDKRTYSRPRHDNIDLRRRNIFVKILRKFLGAMLVIFSIFALVSFVSYIFTAQEDQTAAESFLRYSWNSPIVAAKNWAGITGAALSYVFIYKYLGIVASLLLLFPMFITGIRFLGLRFFKNWDLTKFWSLTIYLIFIIDACLGFIPTDVFCPFAGFLSQNIATMLQNYFGWGAYVFIPGLIVLGLFLFKGHGRRFVREEKSEN